MRIRHLGEYRRERCRRREAAIAVTNGQAPMHDRCLTDRVDR